MRKGKKAIVIGALVSFLISGFSGCAIQKGTEINSGSSNTTDEFATPGGNKYDEVVEVTTIRSLGSNVTFENGDSIEDNIWTRTALEEYNIKIKYLWTTTNTEYEEKFNLMLSSGDLPDYFFGTASNLEFLHNEGVLQEIGGVADQYLSEYNKKILTDYDGGAAQKLATINDKRYAIVQPAGHESNAYIMWIRQDWLNKLGLDVPTTFSELTNVLKAFYEDDPAETGKDNYIPLGLTSSSWTGSLKGLMNVLGAYKEIWLNKDGKYVYSSIQPEMKTALSQIANYYKLGYISDTYFNASEGRIVELMGLNRTGVCFANYVSGVLIAKSWPKNNAEWVTYPLPAMDASSYPAKSQISSAADTYWYTTTSCKHPDAVMKLFNLYSDKITNDYDTYGISKSGIEIFNYMYPQLGSPNANIDGYLAMKQSLETGSTDNLTSLFKNRFDSALKYYQNGSTSSDDWAMWNVYGTGGALETTYKNYFSTNNYFKDAWGRADTTTMASSWPTLITYENEVFQQIITGEKPIDYFDTFVTEWNRMGGEAITSEVNVALK